MNVRLGGAARVGVRGPRSTASVPSGTDHRYTHGVHDGSCGMCPQEGGETDVQ